MATTLKRPIIEDFQSRNWPANTRLGQFQIHGSRMYRGVQLIYVSCAAHATESVVAFSAALQGATLQCGCKSYPNESCGDTPDYTLHIQGFRNSDEALTDWTQAESARRIRDTKATQALEALFWLTDDTKDVAPSLDKVKPKQPILRRSAAKKAAKRRR